MPNGRRWNISYPRKFTAGGIIAVGLFLASAGAGMRRWSVVAAGVALIALAVALIVISAIRSGARSFVRGSAHVLDVTSAPANTELARCEMHVVVEAEGLTPVKVKIHDDRTPVAKWPDIGDTLPVRVAVEDPHHVRILWGEVPTHAERAAEEERFQMHVQRIVAAELTADGDADGQPARSVPLDETATLPRPRPRPSPRPRREAGEPDRSAATAASTTGAATVPVGATAGARPSAEEAGRELATSPVAGDDEVPVHDVAPIEGASAVLGNREARETPPGPAEPVAPADERPAVADAPGPDRRSAADERAIGS